MTTTTFSVDSRSRSFENRTIVREDGIAVLCVDRSCVDQIDVTDTAEDGGWFATLHAQNYGEPTTDDGIVSAWAVQFYEDSWKAFSPPTPSLVRFLALLAGLGVDAGEPPLVDVAGMIEALEQAGFVEDQTFHAPVAQ